MDSDTAAIVQSIGNDIVRTFTAITVETFFLAIYTVLVYQVTIILMRKGLSTVPLTMLILIHIMFSMALVMWGFDVTNFVRETQITLINNPELPMGEKYGAALHSIFTLVAPLDLIYAFMSIIGDAIVIWRVWALWGQGPHRWVIALPVACLLGSFTATLILTYCVVHLGTEIVDGSFQSPAFCKNVQTSTYSMATATTAIATILIGVKTWEYRRSIKPMVGSVGTGRATRVERVLILLTESGILYFLFFLVQVIGNAPGVEVNPKMSFAFFVYSYSTSVVVGIYPTVVVILANSTSAVLDTAVASTLTPSKSGFSAFKANSATGLSGRSTGRRTDNDLELSAFTVTTDDDQVPKEGKVPMPYE